MPNKCSISTDPAGDFPHLSTFFPAPVIHQIPSCPNTQAQWSLGIEQPFMQGLFRLSPPRQTHRYHFPVHLPGCQFLFCLGFPSRLHSHGHTSCQWHFQQSSAPSGILDKFNHTVHNSLYRPKPPNCPNYPLAIVNCTIPLLASLSDLLHGFLPIAFTHDIPPDIFLPPSVSPTASRYRNNPHFFLPAFTGS